jgi:hypothetical protein
VLENDHCDQADDGGQYLSGGAGEDGEHLAVLAREVAVGRGYGLAPTQQQRVREDEDAQQRRDHHSEEIEVASGVHGHPAEHASGGVAEAVGHPRLRAVVQGDGEHHHDELKDDQSEVQWHGDSLRETS